MVRSSVLITSLIDTIEKENPAIEEIHSWKVDRHNEPCHEQVLLMKSSDELQSPIKELVGNRYLPTFAEYIF